MTSGSKAFSAFAGIFESGAPQLISRESIADTQTPVSAYLKLAAGTPQTRPADWDDAAAAWNVAQSGLRLPACGYFL